MEWLDVTIDKFVFHIARDCRYAETDVWVRRVGARVRVGLTDYLQQKSGDVAFVEVKPVGTTLAANAELASLETIKVDLVILAPLAGKVLAVNPVLAAHPELVNGDPYGEGWLAEIEPQDSADYDALMDAETYLPRLQARAEEEHEK